MDGPKLKQNLGQKNSLQRYPTLDCLPVPRPFNTSSVQ